MDLKTINQDYEKILQSKTSNYDKAVQFGRLMSIMEKEFSVPLLKNQEWENQNRKVIALYRKISRSRIFD